MKRTSRRPVAARLMCIVWLIGLLWPARLPAQDKTGSQPGKPQTDNLSYVATPGDGLAANLIWTVAFDGEDRPWVGTDKGSALLQDNGEWRWRTAKEGLAGDSVAAYLFAPANRVWIGTDRGLNLMVDDRLVRSYTWSDGLASSGIEDLALDAEGNLWAAHLAEGVSRFDGKQWRKFTTDDGLADNWVYSVAADEDGGLWFGTSAGVSRLEGENWRTYTTGDGLAGDWVADVAAAADGSVWFATDGGVSEFDGAAWTTHLAGRPARAVAVAADGTVWAGGSGFASYWDGAAWHDVQPTYFDDQLLLDLAPRPNGEIWVATHGDGVTILTPKAPAPGGSDSPAQADAALWLGTTNGVTLLMGDEQRRFDVADGLAGADVRAILIDQEGHKWFGTQNGASMYDGVGWTSYYPSAESIASNYVYKVAVDPQGRTWFAYGDRGLGVSVKDGEQWRQYTAADGLAGDRVYSMAFGPEGEVWLGTEHGVSRQNRTRWTSLAAQPGAPDGKIEALAVAPTGELWAGFAGGVAVYDGENWITFGPAAGLDAGIVRAIAFDEAGNVWIGAAPSPAYNDNGGLFVYDNGEWTAFAMNRSQTVYAGPAADPLGDWITDLALDASGQLWIGALAHPLAKPGFVHGGVSVYAGDVLGDVGWTVYAPENGLISEYVTALAIDAAGAVWAGTEHGLMKFDGESWSEWTTANLLPANHVTSLAVTTEGGVWIATAGSGATYYDGETWQHFTTAGLADRAVNALAEDASGDLWFATAGGVSRFDGEQWQAYTTLDGLASNDASAVAVDGSGVVWAGGAADGATGALISRFDGEEWRAYTLDDSALYTRVDALAVDPVGDVWAVAHYANQFSSASALFRFDGEGWVQAAGPGLLSDDQVYAYTIGPDGRHWFGTDGSYDSPTLLMWDGESWQSFRIDAATTPVLAIALAGAAGGWLGTADGLAEFSAADGTVTVTWDAARRKITVQAIAVEPQ